jgi:CRP-like cAMP-binding protein
VLRACVALRCLDARALEDLSRHAEAVRFRRRAAVYEADEAADAVYVLARGRVRLLRSRGERVLTLAYRGAGDLLGEGAFTDAGARTHRAVAVEATEAVRIPVKHARRLVEEHAAFCVEILKLVACELSSLERRLVAVAARPVEARIAAFVAERARVDGVPHARGVALGPKFTHQEIADFVASTRETVTLTLGGLRRRGVVAFERRRLLVLDRAALERLA